LDSVARCRRAHDIRLNGLGALESTPRSICLLNYIDAQARVSAAEASALAAAHFAPAAIDAALCRGGLKTSVLRDLGVSIAWLAAISPLMYPAAIRLTRSHDPHRPRAAAARSAADFDKLDGKMQAKKRSWRFARPARHAPIMSNLSGVGIRGVQDGAIRGSTSPRYPLADLGHAVAGRRGRSSPRILTQLSASVPDREWSGDTSESHSGWPAGEECRGLARSALAAKALAFRGDPTRADHRRPRPHLRPGRSRHSRGDRRPLGLAAHLS